ncbi:MAG: MarR family winged helix-turn-helix transcriptional regulator [Labilithrix sp.]
MQSVGRDRTAGADDASLVVDALRCIVHELRVTAHRAEDEVGLSGAQLFVLRELAIEPGVSIRRLSQRTLTDPSSVSVVVARLVERGLVSRKSDPGDARRSVLAVSPKGRLLLARAPEPFQARLFSALQALPPARLREMRLGLAHVIEQAAVASEGTAPLFFEETRPKKRRRHA